MKWGRGNCVMDQNHNQGYNHNKWLPVIWIMVNTIFPTSLYFTDTLLNCCILCYNILLWLVLDCKIEIAVERILALWCLLGDPVFWILVMWWHFQCTWSCSRRANALQEAASRKRETDWKDGHWTQASLERHEVSHGKKRCGWIVLKRRTAICVRCKRHINPSEDYFKLRSDQLWILK